MEDLPAGTKWCPVLALVLLCACSAHNASIPASNPSGLYADAISEWEPSGYGCKWGPDSSGFPAEHIIDQYGVCGQIRTKTITPMKLDVQSGQMLKSGDAYQLVQIDDPAPSSRRIWADFFKKISPINWVKNGVRYVGIAPGQSSAPIDSQGELFAYLAGNNAGTVGILAASGFPSAGLAANWLSRYSLIDFTDNDGKPLATFAIAFSGKHSKDQYSRLSTLATQRIPERTGRWVFLSPIQNGQAIQEFYAKWRKAPDLVGGIRLHN